jgi:ubiquinone/menaquinone biosynthesis C-methylase UbiE
MNWRGLSYDAILNTPLRGVRRWIARRVAKNDLFPVLDICCGTGAQARGIAGAEGRAVVGLDLDLKILGYARARSSAIPYVCADASSLPFRDLSFKCVVITFALHDKSPEARTRMIEEAVRVLTPSGRIILLDFENPWSPRSRVGNFFVTAIERLAGREHFENGRQFLSKGGLRAFLRDHGLRALDRREVETGSFGIVVASVSRELKRAKKVSVLAVPSSD